MCETLPFWLWFGKINFWHHIFFARFFLCPFCLWRNDYISRGIFFSLIYQALHLLEFLELNTILGASHFTFYNHTLGSRASCVLKHYINGDFLNGDSSNGSKSEYRRPAANQRATVNVLPWDLRMRSQKDIRTEGLFAALNDCVYRNMYR